MESEPTNDNEPAIVLQPIHLGKGEQGKARKEALNKIAARLGFIWNGKPSIGRWLVSLADEELKKSQP